VNTPPSNGVPSGPDIKASHSKKFSSVSGPATIPSGGFWVSSLTQKEINIRIYMYTDLELQYSA